MYFFALSPGFETVTGYIVLTRHDVNKVWPVRDNEREAIIYCVALVVGASD